MRVDGTVVLRERWAWPRLMVNALLVLVALAGPGVAGVVLRPDRPAEGVAALALAAVALCWLAYRAAVSGVEVTEVGIRRLGPRRWSAANRLVPWSDAADVHWHTTYVYVRGPWIRLHTLRVVTPAGPLTLTRYPARDQHAERTTLALHQLGVDVALPVPPDAARR